VTFADRLSSAPVVVLARRALGSGEGVWIAGGAVRDAAMGRSVDDLDLAVSVDPAAGAKAIAREGGGHAFELSAEYATWRAVGADGDWQVDLTALRGATIAGMIVVNNPGTWSAVYPQLEHAEWLRAEDRAVDAEPLLVEARGVFAELQAAPWLERAGAVTASAPTSS